MFHVLCHLSSFSYSTSADHRRLFIDFESRLIKGMFICYLLYLQQVLVESSLHATLGTMISLQPPPFTELQFSLHIIFFYVLWTLVLKIFNKTFCDALVSFFKDNNFFVYLKRWKKIWIWIQSNYIVSIAGVQ